MLIHCLQYIAIYLAKQDIIKILGCSSEIQKLYNNCIFIKQPFLNEIEPFKIDLDLSISQMNKWIYIKSQIIKRYKIKNKYYLIKNPVSIYEVAGYLCNQMKINFDFWNNMNKTEKLHKSKRDGYSFHSLDIEQMSTFINEFYQYHKN